MTKIKKICVYPCLVCGMEYKDMGEAIRCCVPDRSPTLRYECPVCQDFWETEKEAIACCTGAEG